MYYFSDAPDNLISWCIYDILKRKTNENNRFTQSQIMEELEGCGFNISRKTVYRNLRALVDCINKDEESPEAIEYDEKKKSNGDVLRTNYYYRPLFTKGEMQALIYNVVFAKHISYSDKRIILEKLETLGAKAGHYNMKHYIRRDSETDDEFIQLFTYLEQIDEAIGKGLLAKFQYAVLGTDKKYHVDKAENIMLPLGIAARNNDFYMVGIFCGFEHMDPDILIKRVSQMIVTAENRSGFFVDSVRIDQIRALEFIDASEITPEQQKAIRKIRLKDINPEWNNILDYSLQNTSLAAGRKILAKFKMNEGFDGHISDAIDFFGKENVRIETIEEETLEEPRPDGYMKEPTLVKTESYLVTAKTNDGSLREFAKLYAREVEVLEPKYMRDEMLDTFRMAYERMMKSKEEQTND